jgi:hypothetical protein
MEIRAGKTRQRFGDIARTEKGPELAIETGANSEFAISQKLKHKFF